MGWFQSLNAALSTSSQSNSNSQSTQQSNGNTSSTPSNSNTPSAPAGSPSPAPAPDSNPSGTQGPEKSPSLEELLFAPAPAPTQTQTQTQPQPSSKESPTENELAPGLTSKQLVQNLQSVNFLGTIPKETLTAALGGDETAFSSVISSVAQLSAAIAVQQSLTANKAALDKRFSELDGTLTSKIGESKYADILADPKFSNPFVKPLAESLVSRLRERDPSVTPDQIRQVLPSLIEYAMKQSPTAVSPSPIAKPKQAAEINIDELFN